MLDDRMLRRGGPVSPDEMDAVFRAATRDRSTSGARDAALLGLFFQTSIHAADIPRLQAAHYDANAVSVSLPDRKRGTVRLPGESATAMDRWLSIRGGGHGPLITPIRRPDRIIMRTVSHSLLGSVLARRLSQAGVAPFAPDDVMRTRTLNRSGRWFGAEQGEDRKLLYEQPCDGRAALHISQTLVVRFLSRHGQARRAALIERLDRIALLVSGGSDQALSLSWCSLGVNDILRVCRELQRMGMREANLLGNTLFGLVGEGARSGLLSPDISSALISHLPRRQSGPPAWHLGVADTARMIELCLHEATVIGSRDAVLIGALWETGLRMTEILRLPWTHSGEEFACIHSPRSGSRHCLLSCLRSALQRWGTHRPEGATRLLLAVNRSGCATANPVTTAAANWVVDRRGREAGLGRLLAGQVRSSSIWHAISEGELAG